MLAFESFMESQKAEQNHRELADLLTRCAFDPSRMDFLDHSTGPVWWL